MEFFPSDITCDDVGRCHQQQNLQKIEYENGVEQEQKCWQNQQEIFAKYSEKSEDQHQ